MVVVDFLIFFFFSRYLLSCTQYNFSAKKKKKNIKKNILSLYYRVCVCGAHVWAALTGGQLQQFVLFFFLPHIYNVFKYLIWKTKMNNSVTPRRSFNRIEFYKRCRRKRWSFNRTIFGCVVSFFFYIIRVYTTCVVVAAKLPRSLFSYI